MIGGGSVIASSMLIIGTLYATHASDTAAGRWAIIVLIYVFLIGFGCTWAIVIRIICSEIQPMRTRAAATSLGQCLNWVSYHVSPLFTQLFTTKRAGADIFLWQVVNWIIAFSTPLFLAYSSSGPYFLFGGCCLLTTLVSIAFQPETRGSSLEEVVEAFQTSTWKSAFKSLSQKYTNLIESFNAIRYNTRQRVRIPEPRRRGRRGSEVDPIHDGLGENAIVPPGLGEDLDELMDVYELPVVSRIYGSLSKA